MRKLAKRVSHLDFAKTSNYQTAFEFSRLSFFSLAVSRTMTEVENCGCDRREREGK